MRHMLLQDLLLGDLGCASEWASVGRPAGAHRDAGPAARNASTQRSRRHSCRLSSSVTVRATYPMLGGVVMLACLLGVVEMSFPSGARAAVGLPSVPPQRLIRNDCSSRDTRSRGCTANLRHKIAKGAVAQDSEHIRSCRLSH